MAATTIALALSDAAPLAVRCVHSMWPPVQSKFAGTAMAGQFAGRDGAAAPYNTRLRVHCSADPLSGCDAFHRRRQTCFCRVALQSCGLTGSEA